MRIGFFSDPHLSINPEFDPIKEIIKESVDLILSGGDWGVIPYGIDEFKKITRHVPIYSIAGNHDDENILKAYGMLLNEGTNDVLGLKICAVHRAVKPINFYGDWEGYRDFPEMVNVLQKFTEEVGFCDILLTHEPPAYLFRGLTRKHPAFAKILNPYSEFLDLIVAKSLPRLVLCGHRHAVPYFFKEELLEVDYETVISIPTVMVITTLDNTYAIIDYDEKERIVEKITVKSNGKKIFSIKPRYKYEV